jgi:hypothetical protein
MPIPSNFNTEIALNGVGNEAHPQSIIVKDTMWTIYMADYRLLIKEYTGLLFRFDTIFPQQYSLTAAKLDDGTINTNYFWLWVVEIDYTVKVYEIEPFTDSVPVIIRTATVFSGFSSIDFFVEPLQAVRGIALTKDLTTFYAKFIDNPFNATPNTLSTELDWAPNRIGQLSLYSTEGGKYIDPVFLQTASPPNVSHQQLEYFPPENLTVQLSLAPGFIDAYWDPKDGATSYNLQYSLNDPTFSSPVTITGLVLTSQDVPITTTDINYYFRVQAVNALNFMSDWSDTAFIFISAPNAVAPITVNSTLILDGNLTCNNGDILINNTGLVIPVSDEDTMKRYFNAETNTYTFANGVSRFMKSTIGDIIHQGLIDGRGQGFESNEGPGANSLLTDSSGNTLEGYGATHAGVGALFNPTFIVPPPEEPYGFRESPMSLGSGGGYYHNPSDIFGEDVIGGGAIKLMAPSGTVYVDGDILMDGQDGPHCGGAAGGSIWLVGWNINGSGTMSAQGGATYLPSNAGGGGGGYISVWYEQSNIFAGDMLVNGQDDGKIYVKKIEPFFEEPFSGDILNTKWWDTTGNVSLFNGVTLTSPQDNYSFPSILSNFRISGKDIVVDMEYSPVGPETNQYNIEFLLWADPFNWVGLARRRLGIFGISSVDGLVAASGVNFPYEDLTFRLMKNDSTFFFQYYDASSTPQTIYSDILPSLANRDFKVMAEVDKIYAVDFNTETLRLTPLDIARKYVEIFESPADQTSVALNVLHGSPQYYGYDFVTIGNKIHWDTSTASTLKTLLATGDALRISYEWAPVLVNGIQGEFKGLKVFQGVIDNYASQDAVVYVDPDFGSDSSAGGQLSPLQNLFVATAWSKPGGVVVLYDGTYNPTRVKMKDITIRGAEGAHPYITSQFVQDTTGSDWEYNALSFYKSEGLVYNVQVGDSTTGIRVENSPDFEIAKSSAFNTVIGFDFINSDPTVRRCLLHNNEISLDFTSCNGIFINSNVIYDTSAGINIVQCKDTTITGNTIDNDLNHYGNTTAIVFNNFSSGVVSSNCISSGAVGLQASLDSYVSSFNNNYVYLGINFTRPPDASANDISVDPIYVDSINRNYHIALGSPNIAAGLGTYDNYFTDFDGVPRNEG